MEKTALKYFFFFKFITIIKRTKWSWFLDKSQRDLIRKSQMDVCITITFFLIKKKLDK